MAKNIYRELERKAMSLEKSAGYTEDITANEGLNENNVQSCFQYNATTGEYVYVKVDGSIFVDVDSPRVRQQVGSDKICVDMGYSIDGDPRKDWKFTLNGVVLIIQTVAMRSDLVRLNLAKNECAVVTNDPNFRTLVWLNYEANRQTLDYEFTTLNSSISSWMSDEVYRKINKLDTAKIESDILNLNIEVANIDTRLTTAENNINDLDNDVLDINAKLMDNTAEIDILKNNVSTLQTDVVAIADRTLNNENNIEKLQEKTAGITRDENTDTTIFNDDVKLSKKLDVVGKSTLQDIEVKGNVLGVLKDENGYKFIKVKKGTVANSGRFMNMTIEYDGAVAIIRGNYSENNSKIVATLENYSFSPILPQFITKLKKVFFYGTDKENMFSTTTTINDDTSFFINFGNIRSTEKDIYGYTFDFVIEAEINASDTNITWL